MKKKIEFRVVHGTDEGYFYPAFRDKGTKKWIKVYGIYKLADAQKMIRRWKAEIRLDVDALKRVMIRANKIHQKTGERLNEAIKIYNKALEEVERA